jgi:hypothetical protein
MKYHQSVSDFFRIPRWKMNLLLGGVAMLIPLLGQIVLAGWQIGCLWGRGDDDEPARFPPFDFQFFIKYLERGMWPFLVQLVASFVLVPVIMAVMVVVGLMAGFFGAHHGQPSNLAVGALIAGAMCVPLLLMVGFNLVLTPLMVRATITQDFAKAFDPGFVKGFLSRVWREILLAMLYLLCLGLCLMVLAVVTCYVGAFFAAPVVIFSWHHLQRQLYQLYLSRGGAPVPVSHKLSDVPPSLPGA